MTDAILEIYRPQRLLVASVTRKLEESSAMSAVEPTARATR